MHTGPLSYRIDPDDTDPIPCDGDDCDSDGLTARERWEIACWELRREGDPVADRVSR